MLLYVLSDMPDSTHRDAGASCAAASGAFEQTGNPRLQLAVVAVLFFRRKSGILFQDKLMCTVFCRHFLGSLLGRVLGACCFYRHQQQSIKEISGRRAVLSFNDSRERDSCIGLRLFHLAAFPEGAVI